jgi:hypothetical protein
MSSKNSLPFPFPFPGAPMGQSMGQPNGQNGGIPNFFQQLMAMNPDMMKQIISEIQESDGSGDESGSDENESGSGSNDSDKKNNIRTVHFNEKGEEGEEGEEDEEDEECEHVNKKSVTKNNKRVKSKNDKDLVKPEGFDAHHVIYYYFNEMKTGSKRVVTVAYRRDIATGYTHYGACIFRKDYPDECFVKKTHKQTAFERMMKKPIIFEFKADTKEIFLKHLRKVIHRRGVCTTE